MDINSVKRDSGAIAAGQWVSEIPEMGELRLKVRGWSSVEVVKARSRKERAIPRGLRDRNGAIPVDIQVRITSELLAEVVLLDWDGLTSGKKKVPYDAEQAKVWLTNPDYIAFADAVAFAAAAVDRGEYDEVEAVKGNS